MQWTTTWVVGIGIDHMGSRGNRKMQTFPSMDMSSPDHSKCQEFIESCFRNSGFVEGGLDNNMGFQICED